MSDAYSKEVQDTVARMNAEGWCCQYVSEKLGISRNTIYRWGRRHGWKWGKRGKPRRHRNVTDEQLVAARRLATDPEGYTRLQVSIMTGVPYSTLSYWSQTERWEWANYHGRSPDVPQGCDRCFHPRKDECNQHHCACEQPIRVLNWPEAALWSQNGGERAIAEAY